MPSYAYLAYTEAGQRREGRIDAEGTSAAEQALWLEGLKIVELNPASPRKTMADYLPSLYQISRADIILFTRQLATFVGAGVPMSRALGTIAQETASPLFKRVILAVLDDLERGQNLSEALVKHPKVFPTESWTSRAGGGWSSEPSSSPRRAASSSRCEPHAGPTSKTDFPSGCRSWDQSSCRPC